MPGHRRPLPALDQQGGRLLQISTDFFNEARNAYQPEQARAPLGVYGASKAAGEAAVQTIFEQEDANPAHQLVIGPVGKNFALTMLRLHRSGINWVLSPIKWAVPPAPSTSLKPAGKPFRAL